MFEYREDPKIIEMIEEHNKHSKNMDAYMSIPERIIIAEKQLKFAIDKAFFAQAIAEIQTHREVVDMRQQGIKVDFPKSIYERIQPQSVGGIQYEI